MQQLPKDFIDNVTNDPFLEISLLDALSTSSPVSIRKNPFKQSFHFPEERSIEWCKDAVFLKERPSFTKDPLFHAGSYYPQEAGSMLLDYVIKCIELDKQSVVLDLSAAPGGKSTLLASYLEEKGLLVANEVINQRAKILRDNMSKWGSSHVIVANNDPSDFERLPDFFDAIVVDAPCSGEGMFRKDEQARAEWSLESVNLCAARQKRILGDIWGSVKEGGYLIYSTCTFNEKENEENIQWLCENFDAEYLPINAPYQFKQGRNGVGIYGMPGMTETEGFFIAVVRKISGKTSKISLSKRAGKGLTLLKDTQFLTDWCHTEGYLFYQWNERILAIPSNWKQVFLLVQDKLHLVKWGVTIGEFARKGLIPDHDLLMCPSLRKEYPSIELDEQQALHYLKGETFILPTASPNGFVQMTYHQEPIGWIKNIGNRFNNLYPKEYRIRMSI